MNSDSSLYLDEQHSDSFGGDLLSIALIGPDADRRKAVASALAGCKGGETREFFYYPASLDDVPKVVEQHFDIIVIDLDSQPEYALELVESLCAGAQATVMVYSEKTDAELLVRCMRAGAREFLILPLAENIMPEALARAAARRSATRPAAAKKALGRLLVFLGAKGGDGVTTLACNFAVSLAQESGQSTLLIDLDLPLGDAALNLGVTAEYSTINALQNASRLDSAFLSKLLIKHSSGVSVLAAPGKFPQFPATNEAIDKLIQVARQDFENVVIDMGSRLDLMGTSLFKEGATVYLVIQAGIAGLRNSNRLISQYFATEVPKLEIVLNRFQSRSLGVAEEQITKALTRPANWKIPNDYAAVRRMQHTAIPLALEDSPISRLIRQMARTACGLPATPEKGSGFSLKKISRSISAKMAPSEEALAPAQPVPAREPESAVSAPAAARPEVAAAIPAKTADATPAAAAPEAESQAQLALSEGVELTGVAEAEGATEEAETTSSQPAEPQTRVYKGATYVRGEDGQWHLQRTQTGEVIPETPVVAWSTPAPIIYGTALGATQLNAMASVPGTFAYNPSAGDLLPAGEHTLLVTFTPTDTAGYTGAESTVQITVAKAAPAITWPAPGAIFRSAALSATELNATASVPGTFVYTPAAGEVLPAGTHTLSVTFTPADAENYTEAESTVQITVAKATPAITWTAPASVAYGTALSANQLNATASVPGTFVYTPAAGEVLAAGTHKLSASFTPADPESYTEAESAVSLVVTQATPIITWPAPEAIPVGSALSADQLNATALIPGTFVYTPAAGEVLAEGTHTLSVTFTPADAADYAMVQATAQLTVTKAAPGPEIVWPAPAAVVPHELPLEAAQLVADPLPAPVELAPAEAEEPAAEAGPVPRTAKAKVPARPRVKTAKEVPTEVPVEPSAEEPAQVLVIAPAKPAVEEPVEVPMAAPVKQAEEEPVQAQVMAPAKPPVEISVQAPEMAPTEPAVETPAKVPAEVSVKAPAKPHVKATAKTRAKVPAKAPAKASIETSVRPPAVTLVEAPASPASDAPMTALVKAQVPRAPIDVGPGLDLMGSAVFEDGTTIYLVMQPGSSGAPNSNRLVSQFLAAGGPKPDFVINRFDTRSEEAADIQSTTPFAKPGYAPISRQSGQIPRSASDLAATPEKKTGFSLKGFGRNIWARFSAAEKAPSITRLGLAAEEEKASPAAGPTLSDLTASLSSKPAYTPEARTSSAAGPQMPHPPSPAAGRAGLAEAPSISTPKKHEEPQTRTYKGATYVRGADGQWHLQKAEASAVKEETPAVARAMPAPAAASATLPSTEEPRAKSGPAAAKAKATAAKPAPTKAKEPVPKEESEPREIPAKRGAKAAPKPAAKAPAKRAAKAAQKLSVKAASKQLKKAVQKPPAKAAGKQLKKAVQKPPVKAAAKRLKKAVQKPPAKAGARRVNKAAKKPLAKAAAKQVKKAAPKSLAKATVRKHAPASKKFVSAPKRKPAKKAITPSRLAVQGAFPELTVIKPSPEEPVVNGPAAEFTKTD